MTKLIASFGCLGAIFLTTGAMGCGTIRASSGDHLKPDESSASAACTLADASDVFTKLFKERGVPIVGETEASPTTRLLKFKAPRTSVTTVQGSSLNGTGSVSTETYAIGSVYYVWLATNPAGGTKASLLGKPTTNGREVCSPHDWSNIKCDETYAGLGWTGRDQMTGREESEVVTGTLIEYRKSCKAPAQAAVPPPSAQAPAAAPGDAPAAPVPATTSAQPAK
jgi:hypothetical protein